ncbi:WD repeat-containing protein [Aureococcus anophagefferens]|nr:WD repeat-containing protein [Aureococcus anophagefferens]
MSAKGALVSGQRGENARRSGELSSESVSTDGRGCTVREMTWVEFSEDRETIYCGTTSGDFTLVNVRKRSASGTTVAASGRQSLLAKPDGGLVTGGGDGTVTAFDAKLHDVAQVQLRRALVLAGRGELIARRRVGRHLPAPGRPGQGPARLREPRAAVVAVAYSADSSSRRRRSTTRSASGTATTRRRPTCVRDAGEPTCVVYTLDFLISGWSDGKIRAHESDTSTPLWLIDHAHRGGVSALVLANNQRFIMTGGGEGDVRVWELRSRELVSHLKEHRSMVTGLALYEDDLHSSQLAGPELPLLGAAQRERMTSHTQRMGGINSIALSKDQTNVFTVGQEKRLTLGPRDQNFLEAVDLSDDQSDEASCVAVSNSGLVVATGGTKKLLVGETAPGHKPRERRRPQRRHPRPQVLPGRQAARAVGEDGVIFVWNLYVD